MRRFLPAKLAALVSRSPRRPFRRPLAVESLEARDVPAAYSWVPTDPGAYNWNDPANWTGGTAGAFPNGVDDTATLTGAPAGNQLINLNTGITLGGLTIGSTGATGYTIAANGAAGKLTFDTAAGTSSLTATGTGQADAILAPVVLADPTLTLSSTGAAPLFLAGGITGSGTLNTAGAVALLAGTTVGPGVTLAGTGTVSAVPVQYATSFADGALYAFNADTGATLATLVAPYSAGSIDAPSGLTTGPDGNLYISAQGQPSQPGVPSDNAIVRYNLDTFSLSTFITSAQLQAIADPGATNQAYFAPAGIRFGPDGNLYVSQNRGFGSIFLGPVGSVVRFGITPGGGGLTYSGTHTEVASAQSLPNGITFGPAGDETTLYVGTANGVVKVTTATTTPGVPDLFIPGGSAGLEFAAALAFGPDGKLYVADLGAFTGAGKVLRFDANGTGGTQVVAAGSGANPGDLFGQFPSEIQFDAQGRILVGNLGQNGSGSTANNKNLLGTVYRYSIAGAFDTTLVNPAQFPLTSTQTPPAGSPPFSGAMPSQLARTAAGTLTATDVSPAGAVITGTLTVPDLTFAASGSLTIDLNGAAPGTGYDQLVSTGTVNLNGATLVTNIGFSIPVGTALTIVSAADTVGEFSGMPEGFSFNRAGQTFQITYQGGAGGDVVLTRLAATAPTITTAATGTTFYSGKVDNAFQFTATGAPTPTYTVTAGTPPGNVTLSSTGLLSGDPTSGTATFTVTATNPSGADSKVFTVTVVAGVAPLITSLDHAEVNGTTGTGGTPFVVTATGTPTPTLSLTTALPTGVHFDAGTGNLTVDPGTAFGVYTLGFKADNGVGTAATQTFTLTVGVPPTAFGSAATTTFYSGTSNAFTVSANGSPTPTYTVFAGAFPGTVALSPSGALTGDPGTPGDYPVTIRATNALGSLDQSFNLHVVAGTAPSFTSPDHAGFVVGSPHTFTVTADGGPPPTLSVDSASFTPTFDPATGILQVPAASGVYTITFRATNSLGSVTQLVTLTVGTPPALTTPDTSTTFFSGKNNTFQFTATGTPTPTFAVTSGTPPGSVTLSSTGLLSGDPSSGTATFTITVHNGVDPDVTRVFTVTVVAGVAPSFTSLDHALLDGGAGDGFDVTATGTPAPALSTTTVPLPTGVHFNAATGHLTVDPGTPTGQHTITFQADNGVGAPVTQTFTLTVGTAPAFTSGSSTSFTATVTGTFTVTATGSPAPTLAHTAGTLPAGVTFDPATGILTGTTTATGSFPVTFTATNGLGSVNQTFTLTVAAPTVTITPAALPDGEPGQPYFEQLDATGGAAPHTFAVTAGTLPPGVTLSAAGALSGKPTAGGTFTFTVTATDASVGGAGPFTGSQSFTLKVASPPAQTTFPRMVASGTPDGSAKVYDPDPAGKYPTTPTTTIDPFGKITAAVRTTVADVDGDGIPDTIMVTGPGVPVRFAVVSGKDNTTLLIPPTDPFGGTFTGGGFVSAADFNGDGRAEVVVTPDQGGGPNVVLYSLNADGTVAAPKAFFALSNPAFRGGARTTVGDVDGDGIPDLVVGAGFLGGPNAEIHNGRAVAAGDYATLIGGQFFAFDGADAQTLRNGVFLAAGDVNDDGFADLIFGGGPGGGPRVLVLDGKTFVTKGVLAAQSTPLANFFYGDPTNRGGVRVSSKALPNAAEDAVVVGSGEGTSSAVRIYPGPEIRTGGEPGGFQDLDPFGQVLPGGVFVG
jgi:hypothetical protein